MNQPPDLPNHPQGRVKKRFVIPGVLIALVTAILIWGTIIGNLSDDHPRNPSSATDGVLTQLVRNKSGEKTIRAAVIIPVAPERVWQVVTDYDHFSDVFPNVSTSQGVHESDGRWHVTGQVRSIVGRWPMDLHVIHTETPGRFIASWNEPHGDWKINRGSWIVTAHGDGETLLEYNLQIKVAPFPDFVVRAVLLGQLKSVMNGVAHYAEQNQKSR